MNLSDDYKNIVKLRFEDHGSLGVAFFDSFYAGILNPDSFKLSLFNRFDLKDILDYLKKSHSEYLTIWFPKIEKIIDEFQKTNGVNDLSLTLKSFVVNYYNELTNHINFEEKVLYNFAEKLLNGTYVEKEKIFVLNHFLETHNHDVSNELTLIQKIVLNKDPEIIKNSLIANLFDLITVIQNDLTLHGMIEDELLIAKIHLFIEEKF